MRPRAAPVSAGYNIGIDDVLDIVVWTHDGEPDHAGPTDGKISLPPLNEVQAAELTPSKLWT